MVQKRCLVLLFALLTLLLSCLPSAHAQEEIFIRLNQVGYRPANPKVAIAFSRKQLPETFSIIDIRTKETAFTAPLKPVTGSWGEFDHHGEIDFSGLNGPGRYVIQAGTVLSHQFEINDRAFSALPDQMLEFMRQQRCGYNPWLDAVCHSFDGRTAYGPLPAGSYLNATGGWHDAGDLLKYLLTSSNATAQMLLAYQLNSSANRKAIFPDRFNELGQPGANGIPDILDEARWGLEWMLKLHPAPDQLYHQVADDRDHQGWRLPQYEVVDYGWGPGSYRVVYFADGKPQGLQKYQSSSTGVANLAGRYAAAMALGYQIWKDEPRFRDYAQKLLKAGRGVYELGKAKDGVQQGNSYGAPYRYEETTWADDMEWGAAELFRATREKKYLNDARRYAQLAGAESWMGKEQAGHYQFYPFMNVGHFRLHDLVDKNLKKLLAGYYREGMDLTVKASEGNPYRLGVPFIWCSNNLVVALATQVLLYERMTGDRSTKSLPPSRLTGCWAATPGDFRCLRRFRQMESIRVMCI